MKKLFPLTFALCLVFLASSTASFASSEPMKSKMKAKVKVDVVPAQIPQALQALGLSNASGDAGAVYFFDTSDLALFRSNLQIRIRVGQADNDVSVKLRPAQPETISQDWFDLPDFKCEYESFRDRGEAYCEVKNKMPADEIQAGLSSPESLVDEDQKNFSREYAVANIPWQQLRKIGPITSVEWTLQNGVVVELWQVYGLQFLEFSAKVPMDGQAYARSSMLQTLQSIGVQEDPNGENKTEFVMKYLLSH